MTISASYPFLSIAAKYGLPYWAVLLWADRYQRFLRDQMSGTASYWEANGVACVFAMLGGHGERHTAFSRDMLPYIERLA